MKAHELTEAMVGKKVRVTHPVYPIIFGTLTTSAPEFWNDEEGPYTYAASVYEDKVAVWGFYPEDEIELLS